jgi:DMSO/TMAO reductase YedYZ molybdopterin-dependent catalytic subunit
MDATKPAAAVVVSGEVERPLRVDPRELSGWAEREVGIDFHCLEGWSRLGEQYRGVSLAALLRRAGARAEGRWVTIASGAYTVVLSREEAEDERVVLAFELDGQPLSGLRLVGPSEWDCFRSVKAVDRVELTHEAEEATGPGIARARVGR